MSSRDSEELLSKEELDELFNKVFVDQDAETIRAIRRNFRVLLKEIEKGEGDIANFSADEIMQIASRSDELYEDSKRTQDLLLDSEVYLRTSGISTQKARAIKPVTGDFDVNEFVAHLAAFLETDRPIDQASDNDSSDDEREPSHHDASHWRSLSWNKVGRLALANSRRVPAMNFMHGPLSTEQKQRKAVKRTRLEKNKADLTQPRVLTEADIQRSENETTKNVAFLHKLLLSDPEPVNLFKFFINPNSFSQSVENLFYLSFLIRDGHVALDTHKVSKEPYICQVFSSFRSHIYLIIFSRKVPCEQPTAEDILEGVHKQQLVMQFDMETWRRAIEVFKITESRIPHRLPA